MGVTIHFESRLKPVDDFCNVISLVSQFAKRKSAKVVIPDCSDKLLTRSKDGTTKVRLRGFNSNPMRTQALLS